MKNMVLISSKKHQKETESEAHKPSKKNSECFSDGFDKKPGFNIDNQLPPVPSGINNVQGN